MYMYMCFRGIDVASVSTIFRLEFGTGPTLWYFFILLVRLGWLAGLFVFNYTLNNIVILS